MSQDLQLRDPALPFAGTREIAHPFLCIRRRHVALQEEIDAIEILRTAYEEGAADAIFATGPPNAETWVAAVPERDGMQATIPLQHLARLLIRLRHDSFESLGLGVGIDHAERRSGIVHHAQHH